MRTHTTAYPNRTDYKAIGELASLVLFATLAIIDVVAWVSVLSSLARF